MNCNSVGYLYLKYKQNEAELSSVPPQINKLLHLHDIYDNPPVIIIFNLALSCKEQLWSKPSLICVSQLQTGSIPTLAIWNLHTGICFLLILNQWQKKCILVFWSMRVQLKIPSALTSSTEITWQHFDVSPTVTVSKYRQCSIQWT